MLPFYRLSDPQAEVPELVGRKVSDLAALMRRGYRSVPGFVLGGTLWHQFAAKIDWGEPLVDGLPAAALQLDVDDSYQLQSVAQRLQQAVTAELLPPDWRSPLAAHLEMLQTSTVILRPSTAVLKKGTLVPTPMTGLLQSQLATAEVDAVSDSIKALWAQLFSAQSLFYWQRMAIAPAQIQLGVLVQPLMPAIASGQIEINGQELCLSSIHGLGHALTLGEATPEKYHLNMATGQSRVSLVQQAYAYWLQTPPAGPILPAGLKQTSGTTLAPCADGIPEVQYQPLPSRFVADDMGVISPAQRQQLVTLGRSLAANWLPPSEATLAQPRPQLEIEWILCRDRHRNETIYITQFSLPSGSTASRSAKTDLQGSKDKDNKTQHFDQRPASPAVGQHPEATTLKSAAVAGTGASPGQVSGRLYQIKSPRDQVPPGAILLAVDMTPDWMPLIQQVKGIVMEQGGMTSHAAILARELGVPAVVGVANAMQRFQSGDVVSIDGDRGIVTPLTHLTQVDTRRGDDSVVNRDLTRQGNPRQNQLVPTVPQLADKQEYRIRPMGNFCSLSPARDASKTKLMLTLSHVDQLYTVTNVPIDGIGLLRSELLLLPLLTNQHPIQWIASGNQEQLVNRIAASISLLAAAVFPDPVFYRSLNLCTDEFSHLDGAPPVQERNPALGIHGTYSYRIYPELFQAELLALRQVQQAGYTNLRLLLPFVRSVEEIVHAQRLIQQAQLYQIESFQLWIMAEVPSVLLLLPQYVQAGIQGIAIGSNDLTQLLFAADRNNSTLSNSFHAHPAVMQAIEQLVTQANELAIGSCICGDLPRHNPHTIPDLVKWGVGAISVPPSAAAATKEAIAAAEGTQLSNP